MPIRKLERPREWLEADRLIANAFLHPWDEDQQRRKVQEQAEGTTPRPEETWALVNEAGELQSVITTLAHRMWLGGRDLPVGEVHMVGSRMEMRIPSAWLTVPKAASSSSESQPIK